MCSGNKISWCTCLCHQISWSINTHSLDKLRAFLAITVFYNETVSFPVIAWGYQAVPLLETEITVPSLFLIACICDFSVLNCSHFGGKHKYQVISIMLNLAIRFVQWITSKYDKNNNSNKDIKLEKDRYYIMAITNVSINYQSMPSTLISINSIFDILICVCLSMCILRSENKRNALHSSQNWTHITPLPDLHDLCKTPIYSPCLNCTKDKFLYDIQLSVLLNKLQFTPYVIEIIYNQHDAVNLMHDIPWEYDEQ